MQGLRPIYLTSSTTEVEAFVDFPIFLGLALIETSALGMISRTAIAKVKRRLAYFQIASR